MEYIQLFLVNGVLGYFLQSTGYVIAIAAFEKKQLQCKNSFLCALIFSIATYLVRQIGSISFGFHTILIMILFIVISIIIFKTSVYPTVLAVLITSVMTILCETINYGVLSLIFGSDTINEILKGGATLGGQIKTALAGTPTNLLLIVFMVLFYRFQMKRKNKETKNGETGK